MAGGLGLVTSPATEAVMGALRSEQAGAGSAVNDTVREVGGTLGVAVVGSVMSTVYGPSVVDALTAAGAPAPAAEGAADSVFAGLAVAGQLPDGAAGRAAGLPRRGLRRELGGRGGVGRAGRSLVLASCPRARRRGGDGPHPGRGRRVSELASHERTRQRGSAAVDVAPGAVLPDESADLVLLAPLRTGPPGGAELDGALGGEQPAAVGGQHVEAGPPDAAVELQLRGAGARVPGGQQERRISDGEGAVPGPHQLLGGRRPAGAGVQGTAALVVGQPRSARAAPEGHCRTVPAGQYAPVGRRPAWHRRTSGA